MTGVVESRVPSLVSMKIRRAENLMKVKSTEAQSSPIGVLHEDFGAGHRNFEPWASDEDDTSAGTTSRNYHTAQTAGRLSSRQI
ncbi:hypothetical protein TNCV_3235251 [Trichonephila clavipes]|nr:hypothetical protein TNCV_3235251 [Trichonephila clavipes]